MQKDLRPPFFVVNPKNLLYGKALKDLARHANKFTKTYDVDIFFTAPTTELANVAEACPDLLVTAQHMDDISQGDSMGKIIPESLVHIGVQAVVLNHADHLLTMSTLVNSVHRAKELGLKIIVCADSILEAKMMAMLNPDIVLAEPTELIGQKQISSQQYVTSTIESIKHTNPDVLVEQGAGIRSKNDVEELLTLGADGVGVTSGIINAQDPVKMMESMIQAVSVIKKERGKR